MKITLRTMSLLTLLSLAGSAWAQAAAKPTELHIKQLAANCAACHGTNGNAAAGSSVAGLSGYNRDAFVAAMNDFKVGKRQATIMHQLAKGYSDEQIAALADYFSKQKKN
jgi:cytochrome subunit of sulfide dehydrogenase